MRRAIVASCIATVLATTAFLGTASAQGLQALYSRDGIDVWAVGDAGAIQRSFDGGATWTTQTLGTKPFHGVAARNFLVLLVSDDGEVRRSTNSGGTWSLATIPGASHLRAIEMVDATTGWIVGDNGKIYKTSDGGQNWTEQTSGTSQRLNAVRFRDASNGWAVGAGGTVLRTTDGGAIWAPVSVGTTKTLRCVDFVGTNVWAAGNDATCKVSSDGTVFTDLGLKIDSRSDVTGVWMESATNVVLTGGGGFLRKTTDGGNTWTFQKNPLLAETSDLFYWNGGTKGWATHTTNKGVIRTVDSGATWTWLGSSSRGFVQKATSPGTIRGNTLCQNGQNKNTYYVAMATTVYKSTNRGETWSSIGTISGGGSKTNAFYVSPVDSMVMVAAVGAPDRISRSTNGGSTWTTTLTRDFTEYGVPLEMNQDKPSDLYFGPEDGALYYSSDFGATWSTLSTPGFRSPCDIQVVQDNNNVIWVGDGVTGSGNGQMFRSTNGGVTFSLIYTASGSEVPMISGSHLNPSLGLSTHWSSGGVNRTTNMGASWSQVNTAGSAWGTDIAKDDPLTAVFGVYSGGTVYLSQDAGASGTWQTTGLSGTNYAFYYYDRATLCVLQGNGVYKMTNTYTATTNNTQSVTLTAPNGGEVYTAGNLVNITWTAANLGLAHIEYRKNAVSSWQAVADVAGYAATYAWLVPPDATTQAEIRVSDAWDSAPIDGSNATFTIQAAVLAAAPATLDFGPQAITTTSTLAVLVSNTGTAPLNAALAVTGAGFALNGAANIVVAPGGSQNVNVDFTPTAIALYSGSLDVSGNVATPASIGLAGEGIQPAALGLDVPDGGEAWQYGTVHSIQWQSVALASLKLEYQTSGAGPWLSIADNVPASPPQYSWTIPNAATSQARVRVTQVGGGLVDQSANVFAITVPFYAASVDTVDVGLVNVGSTGQQSVTISNPGTAPLTISSVTDDGKAFGASLGNFVVPSFGSQALDLTFSPTTVGVQYATFTLSGDDPTSPHTVVARGNGQLPSDVGNLPTTYGLAYDGPNPFHGVTSLHYRLPERTAVTIDVYDLQGRRVALLVKGVQGPGEYSTPFGSNVVTTAGEHTGDLAAGVYFARMKAGNFSKTSKLVMAR